MVEKREKPIQKIVICELSFFEKYKSFSGRGTLGVLGERRNRFPENTKFDFFPVRLPGATLESANFTTSAEAK